MPSETSEKLQKYRMPRRNFGDFGCIFRQCLQRLDDLQNWHHFQKVLDSVWNFAVAYSRTLVSLLYFFSRSFGFLPGLFIASVSARFASWKYIFFSVGSPKT